MAQISYSSKREVRLGSLFLKLAEVLDSDFDVAEYLQNLVDETKALLPVEDVALFLVDKSGALHVAAATAPDAHEAETLVLQAESSPCLHAYETGTAVGVDDIRTIEKAEWADFAGILQNAGFRSVHAVPMRIRETTVGVVSLFSRYAYSPSDVDAEIAATIMKAAAIALVQSRALTEQRVVTEQLQHALKSRISIEQAKGVVAQTCQLGMDEAFTLIRAHARHTNQTLYDVSTKIIDRSLILEAKVPGGRHG
jgi:GAF domain-containing protein